MAYVLGMNCKAYYGASALDIADASTGSWTEMTNVKDVTINLETGEADITTRANSGWRATAATLKDGTIEFEMQWDPSDAGFTKIQTAWTNSAEVALAAMFGDIDEAGTQGLAGNFTITNFSASQPLEEASTVSVTAKPSSQTHWYTVAGS